MCLSFKESLLEELHSHVSLLGKFDFSELISMSHHVLVLDAHDTTTPGSSELFIFVELSTEVLCEELQVLVVFLSHFGKGDACGSLLMDEFAESCLALDEAEGDALLSAERGEENKQFNWVNIVSHHNELGLALLNKSSHVVETVFENNGLGGLLDLWTFLFILGITLRLGLGLGFSFGKESLLFVFVGLWLILSKQFKKLACY